MSIATTFETPVSNVPSTSKQRLLLLSAYWLAVTIVAGCDPALAQQSSTPDQSTLPAGGSAVLPLPQPQFRRSEERRVGKECNSRWQPWRNQKVERN